MKLSVIVCTYNRAYAIAACLDSIAASLAHASPIDAEIVVVDNNSKDDTSAVVRQWAASSSFPVTLLLETRQGLAVARNCGIKGSKGELLVFTDDDCRLSAEYITDAMRHDSNNPDPVLRGGRVELGDKDDLPITIKLDNETQRWHRSMKSAKCQNLANCIVGCNMVMRREVTERLGPFDWRFSTKDVPAGEDADYIFRAYLAGITIEYVPDMAVFHHHGRKTSEDGKKLFRNYMLGSGALYVKHFVRDPNLCRQFYWDFKDWVLGMLSRKASYLDAIGFSHKDKVVYNMLGSMRYIVSFIKHAG